ncbi:MAG: type VI secretion system ATPase TssH [Candidatus Entotheonellia bacterium]
MHVDLEALIGKLNPTCRKGLEEAAGLCVSLTHYHIEIEHYLLKLLELPSTDLLQLLHGYDVNPADVSRDLTQALEKLKRGNSHTPTLSPHLLSLLQLAWLHSSLHLRADVVRSGAVLLALLDQEVLRGVVQEACPALLHMPLEALHRDIRAWIRGTVEDPASDSPAAEGNRQGSPLSSPGDALSRTPALDQYTIDLTARARDGMVDPIWGRDFEIRQVIDSLMRRRQNNPILVGEAGVGKTAIVEGFAIRVARGYVPPPLQKISVRILDLGLLQAGTGVRGEFEQRLKSVIAEVLGSPHPIILFIDEAHALIGAGGPAGQGDAANLLKPALARGELRTIAATTWSEYKRYFEKDPALARRFQVIKIDEPDEATAIGMLQGVAANLERHHNVRILSEAVREAVKLSRRYISGRQLPDKAISVLDTACARVAIGQTGMPPALEDTIRRIELLEFDLAVSAREQTSGQNYADRLVDLSDELAKLKEVRRGLENRWTRELVEVQRIRGLEDELATLSAAEARETAAIERLTTKLARAKADLAALQGDEPMVSLCVDARVVAAVISGWTGIPIGRVLTDELRTVMTLKERMTERLVGQPQALDAICRRIRTSRADMVDPGKPVGVFLLLGPSGVGKTETAICLVDLLYGGERNMVVINMSEYQEAHTVSALKGAPPGYVGYGRGGILTEAVRRHPYTVVLLDEVEKAHADVMELFYQVFDKGTLEDAEGVAVDFKHTIILLTSNVGAETIIAACRESQHRPDVDTLVDLVRPDLLTHFRPALLGRLVLVPYYPLGHSEIHEIVKLKLAKIQQQFAEKYRAELSYDPALVTAIAARCTEVESGARNVDQCLTQTLLPELSGRLLMRMALGTHFSRVHVSLDNAGGFVYAFIPHASPVHTPQHTPAQTDEAIAMGETAEAIPVNPSLQTP